MMRTGWMMLLAAVAAPAMAQGGQPLQPSGKWVVEYEDNLCVLHRRFGIDDGQITFGLRPFPIPQEFEVVLMEGDRGGARMKTATARITLAPSGKVVSVDSRILRYSKRRFTTFNIQRSELDGIAASKTVTIAIGKEALVVLAPTRTAAAIAALDTCQTDLLKGWGIDMAALAAIATPAEAADKSYWITDNDYPDEAVNMGAQGMTAILWTIGIDGKVTDCRTVKSSGHAILDEAACRAIVRRGRYKPALDKQGKPTMSWASRRVHWILPDS